MAPPLPNIEHVILLMFENRSFDNVLGDFYPATSNPDGGGVPAGWSNPLANAASVAAWNAQVGSSAQNLPFPDPQESYADMYMQINTPGPMQGFVNNYATVAGATPRNIMQYFGAGNLPVTKAWQPLMPSAIVTSRLVQCRRGPIACSRSAARRVTTRAPKPHT